ncbi:MAG TPA: hypothetical protein VFZ55_05975 [Nitrososphaera sp.]
MGLQKTVSLVFRKKLRNESTLLPKHFCSEVASSLYIAKVVYDVKYQPAVKIPEQEYKKTDKAGALYN